MLLTGYVPSSALDPNNRDLVIATAEEFDLAMQSTRGMRKCDIINDRVEHLFSIILDVEAEPQRVEYAIWILGQYSESTTGDFTIHEYVSRTEPISRKQQWKEIKETIKMPVGWDEQKGKATGMSAVARFMFHEVGF